MGMMHVSIAGLHQASCTRRRMMHKIIMRIFKSWLPIPHSCEKEIYLQKSPTWWKTFSVHKTLSLIKLKYLLQLYHIYCYQEVQGKALMLLEFQYFQVQQNYPQSSVTAIQWQIIFKVVDAAIMKIASRSSLPAQQASYLKVNAFPVFPVKLSIFQFTTVLNPLRYHQGARTLHSILRRQVITKQIQRDRRHKISS